jgi:hypothetical protein
MGTFVLDAGADWREETAAARNPDSGLPVAAALPLIIE